MSPAPPDAPRAPLSVYAGMFLASSGVLMLEILLTRVFSFTVWYHLAYLTISTALLGFAAGGVVLSLYPGLAEAGTRARRTSAFGAAGAGVLLLVGMAVLGSRPISPDRLFNEPAGFFGELLGYYAVVSIPFFFGGLAVAAPLAAYPSQANRLYATDLLGAGIGCALAVAGLTWLDAPQALWLCGAALVAAGAFYAGRTPLMPALAALALALAASTPLAGRVIEFVPTETKALAQALRYPGTEVLYTRWTPVNRVDLYKISGLRGGFWGSVGRSSRFRGQAPECTSIQYDAHNGSDIFRIEDGQPLTLMDGHLLSTPYALAPRRQVLVIGVGGGVDVLNALHHGVDRVTGVELQPVTIELLKGRMVEWTGGAFLRPEVELVAGEGRHYVRTHDDPRDLIQITAVDTFSAQSTGAYVLAESYLYTVEAFRDYLRRLSDDGVISVVLGDPLYADYSLPQPLVTRLALIARRALELEVFTDGGIGTLLVS